MPLCLSVFRCVFLMNKDILLNKTQFSYQPKEFTVDKILFICRETAFQHGGHQFPKTPSVPLTPPVQDSVEDPALQLFVVSLFLIRNMDHLLSLS